MPDIGPNAYLRAQKAAKEVVLPAGPKISLQDIAERYHVTIDQLVSMVEQERRRTTLTEREKEVLISYAGGRLRKEIAADLGLSLRTVHRHLDNCRRKLGLNTKTKVLEFCILAGWMHPGQGLSAAALVSAEKYREEGQQVPISPQ